MEQGLLYQEVFVVGTVGGDIGDIAFLTSIEEVVENLSFVDAVTAFDEICVFHGVLTPAKYIPPKFYGKRPHLIYVKPSDVSKGAIAELKAKNMQDLADMLERFMSGARVEGEPTISIDDVYILYGYSIPTCLSINPENLDEEEISTANIIADDIIDIANGFVDDDDEKEVSV